MFHRRRPGVGDRGALERTAIACACGHCRRGPAQGRTGFFFEPQSFTPQEPPYRVVRDVHTACRQFRLQPMQAQMWRLAEPLDDEVAMRLQNTLAVAAHLARCDRTRRPVALRPLHSGRNGNSETRRNRPATLASHNGVHNTLTKIFGKGSCHPMLASCPSQHLESQNKHKWNPKRFNQNLKCTRCELRLD